VHAFNQRTIAQILDMIRTLGALVGAADRADRLAWCGKKFQPSKVAARPGWKDVPAVRDHELHEIKSPLILQPGPAALTDGVRAIHAHIHRWANR